MIGFGRVRGVLANRHGTLLYHDDDPFGRLQYTGEWFNNKRRGRGKLTLVKNGYYEVRFSEGMQ